MDELRTIGLAVTTAIVAVFNTVTALCMQVLNRWGGHEFDPDNAHWGLTCVEAQELINAYREQAAEEAAAE